MKLSKQDEEALEAWHADEVSHGICEEVRRALVDENTEYGGMREACGFVAGAAWQRSKDKQNLPTRGRSKNCAKEIV